LPQGEGLLGFRDEKRNMQNSGWKKHVTGVEEAGQVQGNEEGS
jgi:hypothetical protein